MIRFHPLLLLPVVAGILCPYSLFAQDLLARPLAVHGVSSFYDVAFGGDASTLVVSQGHAITVLDIDTRAVRQTLAGPESNVSDFVVSPDGALVAAAYDDLGIRLWDVATGNLRFTLSGHTVGLSSLALSADGRYLASGGYDCLVKLWDVKTGALLHTLFGHNARIDAVAFTPNAHLLVTAGVDRSIRVWNVETGSLLRTFFVDSRGGIASIDVSPDGGRIVYGGYDKSAAVLDLATGARLFSLPAHPGVPNPVRFTEDGMRIITANSTDKSIRIFSAYDGTPLKTLTNAGAQFDVSPDSRSLIAGGYPQPITRWDIQSGQKQTTFRTGRRIQSFALSPDGSIYALSYESGGTEIELMDRATGRLLRVLSGLAAPAGAMAFSPSGSLLAAATNNGQVLLWDPSTGDLLRGFAADSEDMVSLAFSPDGAILAEATGKQSATLWDVQTGAAAAQVGGLYCDARSVAFSPDGGLVALGGIGCTFASDIVTPTPSPSPSPTLPHPASPSSDTKEWGSAPSLYILYTPTVTPSPIPTPFGSAQLGPLPVLAGAPVSLVSSSTDGSSAAGKAASTLPGAQYWAAQAGVQGFCGMNGEVHDIAFSPDRRILLTANASCSYPVGPYYQQYYVQSWPSIRLWDLSSGSPIWEIQEYWELCGSPASLSPDGRYVAYTEYLNNYPDYGLYGVVRGPLDSPRNVLVRGHSSGLVGIQFAPDQSWVVTASMDGTVRFWDAVLPRILTSASVHPNGWMLYGDSLSTPGPTPSPTPTLIPPPTWPPTPSPTAAPSAIPTPYTSNGEAFTASSTLIVGGDGGELGTSLSGAGDVDADGIEDFLLGAPENFYDNTDTGSAYWLRGVPGGIAPGGWFNTDWIDGSNGARFRASSSFRQLGATVAGAGDVNSDGFNDFLISRAPASAPPRAWLVFGGENVGDPGSGDLSLDTLPSSRVLSLSSSTQPSGVALSGAGDVNGDGTDDFLVGTMNSSPASESYLVFGAAGLRANPSPLDLNTLQGAAGVRFSGVYTGSFQGVNVSGVGDVNGDGYDDLLLGGPGMDAAGRPGAGTAWLVFGRPVFPSVGGLIKVDDLIGTGSVRMVGPASYSNLATSAAPAGDVDGDGYDDFLVCASFQGSAYTRPPGEAFLIYGGPDGPGSSGQLDLGQDDERFFTRILSHALTTNSGLKVAGPGDLNGDGFDDLALLDVAGDCYILYGSPVRAGTLGEFPLRWLGKERGFRLTGDPSAAIGSAGDVNADGLPDLLLGRPAVVTGEMEPYHYVYGQVLLLHGRASATRATYFAHVRAGDAAPRAIGLLRNGMSSIPPSRCWIDYPAGRGNGKDGASSETVELIRAAPSPSAVPPLGFAFAPVRWVLSTDRAGWNSVTVRFHYLDSEIQGLYESSLQIARADHPEGPYTILTSDLDPRRHTVSAETTSLGYFALAGAAGAPEPSPTPTFVVTPSPTLWPTPITPTPTWYWYQPAAQP